jgi:hypothetical protein
MTNKIEQAIDDGFAVLIYPNSLGTATVAFLDGEHWGAVQSEIDDLPEDQIIDVRRPLTDAAAAEGVAQVRLKINREGEYADWDARMQKLGLDPEYKTSAAEDKNAN